MGYLIATKMNIAALTIDKCPDNTYNAASYNDVKPVYISFVKDSNPAVELVTKLANFFNNEIPGTNSVLEILPTGTTPVWSPGTYTLTYRAGLEDESTEELNLLPQ